MCRTCAAQGHVIEVLLVGRCCNGGLPGAKHHAPQSHLGVLHEKLKLCQALAIEDLYELCWNRLAQNPSTVMPEKPTKDIRIHQNSIGSTNNNSEASAGMWEPLNEITKQWMTTQKSRRTFSCFVFFSVGGSL